jgi:pyruvate dehydrogenase E1 component alpha subunit
MADSGAYRSALEVAELKARDPLLNLRNRALENGWVSEEEIEALHQKAHGVVEEAVRFAEQSPAPVDLYKDVYQRPLNLYEGLP